MANNELKHNYAATVGFFDGVHTGHRYLIDQLIESAVRHGLESMIVTFSQHPRLVMQADYKPLLLSTAQDKVRMLQNTAADRCQVIDFTPEFSRLTAREFMQNILRDQLGIKLLLMGHDHRFGHDGNKTIQEYISIGQEVGITVEQAQALVYQGAPVSSSRIRSALSTGNAELANRMLGYRYSISGTVVHGFKNGRKMGFPTANLGPYCELMQIPANGVYAAWATIHGERYMSMLNIGYRPTFNGTDRRTIEAHILDFDQDIYEEDLRLEFVQYIRTEIKFGSVPELAAQLTRDKQLTRDILSKQL